MLGWENYGFDVEAFGGRLEEISTNSVQSEAIIVAVKESFNIALLTNALSNSTIPSM